MLIDECASRHINYVRTQYSNACIIIQWFFWLKCDKNQDNSMNACKASLNDKYSKGIHFCKICPITFTQPLIENNCINYSLHELYDGTNLIIIK